MQHLYKAVVGEKHSDYYLRRFEQFDKSGARYAVSWNWPAFFTTAVWALYRKMTNWFWVMSAVTLAVGAIDRRGFEVPAVVLAISAHLAFGVFATSIYHSEVREKVEAARATFKDERKVEEYLMADGGVRPWVAWMFGTLYLVLVVLVVIL